MTIAALTVENIQLGLAYVVRADGLAYVVQADVGLAFYIRISRQQRESDTGPS